MPTHRPRLVADPDTLSPLRPTAVASSRPRLVAAESARAPWTAGPSYRGRLDFVTPVAFSVLPAGDEELYMGSSGSPMPGGGTFYMGAAAAHLDFDEVGIPMSAGQLSKFRVHAGAPPGANNSWTYTVCKNGTPTAMACTVSGASDQDGAYVDTALDVADGDKVTIRRQTTQGGDPPPLTMHNWTAIFSPS